MIISQIERLELPSFGHMTTYTTLFDSHDQLLLVRTRTEVVAS